MTLKHITIAFSFAFLPSIILANGDGDHKKNAKDYKKYHNWHHGDHKADKMMGVSTRKAYDYIKENNLSPKKKIIVAVIDGGIDVQHEDLKNIIWINKDEIDGNGIDDDKNGYVDDIYGWNFLGHPDGKNVGPENLELTRIYRDLKPKYDGKSEEDIDASDKEEFALYQEVKNTYETDRAKYSQILTQNKQLLGILPMIDAAIEKELGKKDYTLEEVKAISTEDEMLKQMVTAKTQLMKQNVTVADLENQISHLKDYVDNYYNVEFVARKEIIGDDPTDIKDTKYGNPDVKGPDAYHGTFVAGLIGAERGNGIGIDGIAGNIEIMAIRAIPGGDEYDKDVALGIRYAVDNGAQVINMSFGKMYSPNKEMVDEAIKYAESKGVLLVNAAGNDHTDVDEHPHYPIDRYNGGEVKNMLTVGAASMDRKKEMPGVFSNYGKNHVDVFAPGVDIVSCTPESLYHKGNGTSYASPITAGIAAMVWSYFPKLTAAELKEIIMESAVDKGKKKVYLPNRGSDEKIKIKFNELCVSGGIANVYNAFLLAEERSK